MPEAKVVKINIKPKSTSDKTPLYRTKNYLSKSLGSGISIYSDEKSSFISIKGSTKGQVDILMARYNKTLPKHHGIDFTYDVVEECITERQQIKEEIRAQYKGEIEILRKELGRLGEKFGEEKNGYEDEIEDLGEIIRKQQEQSTRELKRYQAELSDVESKYSKLIILANKRIDNLTDEFYKTPVHKLIWNYFLRLVRE